METDVEVEDAGELLTKLAESDFEKLAAGVLSALIEHAAESEANMLGMHKVLVSLGDMLGLEPQYKETH